MSIAATPEALGLVPAGRDGAAVLATGSDPRGLVYALLELADRVEHGDDPLAALRIDRPVVQRPANAVRSVARCFASEPDDLPWFRDEGFWRRYLSMVVAQRFNRVNLMVGLGYNFPWHVTDAYFLFPYPFLVDVAGYRVRVPQLPDEERERNLSMLRFAADEAVACGLDFRLGLWTHAYEWLDSPDARHTVEGLTPELHADYCRDALQAVLQACPSIGGLTLRTHGESGVPERSWAFWRTVLDGVVRAGRTVGIDLHAKGLDAPTLEIALATGMPVTISPKYAAEHMGLPYHQAAIRELDRPPADGDHRTGKASFMKVSEGSRPFTRYGYGDFLREDRPYDVVFRIWPGTQRVLLWGDPAMASGFGRLAGIAGTQGLEWCEPFSLKGREGTARPGPRDGYVDASLSSGGDWEKHEYTFRLFGRLAYDPESEPETWRRSLRPAFGTAAGHAEAALAGASRVLPLVTTAHHPSASNNYYWPEIYTHIGIVDAGGSVETHYYDTPEPKRFGTVGPLDPEIFVGAEEAVRETAEGRPSGRATPLDVAAWLERLAGEADRSRADVERSLADPAEPAARRLVVDVAIQAALGRFFAGAMRADVLYEIARRTGSRVTLPDAVEALRVAREAWASAADAASGVYVDDLTYGPQPWLRGTWRDRLPAIDRDLGALEALDRAAPAGTDTQDAEARRIAADLCRPAPTVSLVHVPPASFVPGDPVEIALTVDGRDAASVTAVHLRYRRLDQSAVYEEVPMTRDGDRFSARIPGEYGATPYPLQYFFAVRDLAGRVRLHPRFAADLSNQPYHVIRADHTVRL